MSTATAPRWLDAAFNWLAARPSRIHLFVLACGLVAAAYQGIAP